VALGMLGVVALAVLASALMWWATRRNAFWAMAAGAVFALAIFAVAVLIAWLIARAAYGS
jgi:hypothetical protein